VVAVSFDAKLMVVPCSSREEAHYLAAILNSGLVGRYVGAFSLRLQISTHILDHLRVPAFDHGNALHRALITTGGGNNESLIGDIFRLQDSLIR
jgi:hypothetical protein